MPSRRSLRVAFAAVLLLSAAALAYGAATAKRTGDADSLSRPALRENVTVVTESAR